MDRRDYNQNPPGICFADVRDPLFPSAKFGCKVHGPILNYLLGFLRRNFVSCDVGDVCIAPFPK